MLVGYCFYCFYYSNYLVEPIIYVENNFEFRNILGYVGTSGFLGLEYSESKGVIVLFNLFDVFKEILLFRRNLDKYRCLLKNEKEDYLILCFLFLVVLGAGLIARRHRVSLYCIRVALLFDAQRGRSLVIDSFCNKIQMLDMDVQYGHL